MKSVILYILLLVFGVIVFVPAFAIAVCASALVVFVDELIEKELRDIINGRESNR